MKKLLIAIVLLLVFGITSAAISLGRGSFDSSGSSGSSGGGGSSDVVRGTAGARAGSADGGSFAFPQGTGMGGGYMLSGGPGGQPGGSSVPTRPGEGAYGGQNNDPSFEAGLQRSAELFAPRTAPNGDSVGDGSRNAYSAGAPSAGLQPLGAAGPGSSSSRSIASQERLVVPDGDPIATPTTDPIATPVPEPETYAMLLAGLGLMAVVVRRRKAMQS